MREQPGKPWYLSADRRSTDGRRDGAEERRGPRGLVTKMTARMRRCHMINTPEVANQVANHCNLHNLVIDLVHRHECVGSRRRPGPRAR